MASSRGRPPRAWRIVRLICAAAGAALVAGACRLDDRTLSEDGLTNRSNLGAEECPEVGDNACETCLYRDCCAELQACGPGSPCARYLACVTNCDADQACIDGCGSDTPVGLGSAVALSVCAGGRCTVCSGETPTAACDPAGPGACQSDGDCAALETGALEDLDVSACPGCDDDLVAPACQRCLAGQTGLSAGCSACVAEWLACAVENCLLSCQGGIDPDACERCMSEAGCTGQLESCGFGA